MKKSDYFNNSQTKKTKNVTAKVTWRFLEKSGNIQAWHGKSGQNRHGGFQHHPKFLSPL